MYMQWMQGQKGAELSLIVKCMGNLKQANETKRKKI